MSKASRRRWIGIAGLLLVLASVGLWLAVGGASFERRFDASYVGSEVCGGCHTLTYQDWLVSPHRNIIQAADTSSVIGDFDGHEWQLPHTAPAEQRGQVVARMAHQGDQHVMAIRRPNGEGFTEFPIEKVVGYQYRQEYLTREPGGVLRRLPLQWSTARGEFFPYWNEQENSQPSVDDLWAQMQVPNSAWNLFCARCHTTNLEIHSRDPAHTRANVSWTETGIACEACHGPGSLHVEYMDSSWINRLAMFVRGKFQDLPVAYIASAEKLPKGQALSVCGRCHGADIFARNQDIYREFEPGYSRHGRINDLSAYFRQAPLTPGRQTPTVEVWANGKPKGIGMLFRSMIESACYQQAGVRCQDCHDPHNNKLPAEPGLLSASEESNQWCLGCHQSLQVESHSNHVPGQAGSFCYDCHLPRHIYKFARGIDEFARTHEFSSIPDPKSSALFGIDKAPNACHDCHSDQGQPWVIEAMERFWPGSTGNQLDTLAGFGTPDKS